MYYYVVFYCAHLRRVRYEDLFPQDGRGEISIADGDTRFHVTALILLVEDVHAILPEHVAVHPLWPG